ncbi:MAG: glutamate--tRNA ligase [Calditrichia bacterium]|nr:glutamate--tRNA ligase [Calditrichia bacterium]
MTKNICTRFAPSPTGYLHVGGLRTALYNFLFARHQGGKMILRIEDTDRARFVPGATENLIKTLKFMGITYNEGPDKPGSQGPYIQSERTTKYQEHADKLIEQGDAYYCFCTPERLETLRKQQEAAKQQSKYDGHCRNLNPSQISGNLENDQPHVIRLKMPLEGETHFNDLIRGEVVVQNELTDDQILIKSDGYPTYHLANVIDDHYMNVSHVIRGEEWLLSVPKHLRLYQAFGWEPPLMAHLPLLLNPDKSKLSKRQGDVAVEDFLEKGYLPDALNNFVALLGWNPGNDQEIFGVEELIESFSLERVNKSGAVFDVQKLNWMNGQYIRQLAQEKRYQFLAPYLSKAGYDISDTQKTQRVIDAVYKRLSYGDEIEKEASIFYSEDLVISEPEARQILAKPSAKTVLKHFVEKIESQEDVNLEIFSNVMKEIQLETNIVKQELWMPVRVALTGVTHGPDLPLVIEIFGKKKIAHFVKQALNI